MNNRFLRLVNVISVITLLTGLIFALSVYAEPPTKPTEPAPIPRPFLPGTSSIEAPAARFSPDGTKIVLLSSFTDPARRIGGELSLWDVQTGKILWRIDKVQVARFKFSQDGKTIACLEVTGASYPYRSNEIRLRDARTGQLLPKPSFKVFDFSSGFAVSPDGGIVALSGYPKREVVLKNAATGETIKTLDGADFPFGGDVTFSPDGRYLAARPDNDQPGYNLNSPQLIIWETATGKALYRHADRNEMHEGMFESIHVTLDPAFFTSNTRLVCSDSVLDLDRQPLQLRPMIREKDMHSGFQDVRLFVGFLDQGNPEQSIPHLALFRVKNVEDATQQLEVWDITKKKRIKVIPEPKDFYSRILDYSPITHLVAHCSSQGILTLQRF